MSTIIWHLTMKTELIHSNKYAKIIVINLPLGFLFINQVDKDILYYHYIKISRYWMLYITQVLSNKNWRLFNKDVYVNMVVRIIP